MTIRLPRALGLVLLVPVLIWVFIRAVDMHQMNEFSALVATVGGVIAVASYTHAVSIARLEWLLALFHRYMDEERFRRIRYIMTFRVSPQYGQLKELMEHRTERRTDQPCDRFDESLILDMDDYLNFFELIGALWLKGELKTSEIRMLYNDYIRCLWQIRFTHQYIVNWGFESLAQLATALFGDGPLEDTSTPTSRGAPGGNWVSGRTSVRAGA